MVDRWLHCLLWHCLVDSWLHRLPLHCRWLLNCSLLHCLLKLLNFLLRCRKSLNCFLCLPWLHYLWRLTRRVLILRLLPHVGGLPRLRLLRSLLIAMIQMLAILQFICEPCVGILRDDQFGFL